MRAGDLAYKKEKQDVEDSMPEDSQRNEQEHEQLESYVVNRPRTT